VRPFLAPIAFALACRAPGAAGPLDLPAGDGGALDGGSGDGGAGDGGVGDGGDSGGDGGDTGGDGGDTGGGGTGPPRAVLLFIGDGMGFVHVAGGGQYLHGARGSLRMEELPTAASIQTASLTGYTDSAAAATALATGHKTWNGVIGMDVHLTEVQNAIELARSRGMATGVVTTDGVYGATPASFLAHVSSRTSNDEIAAQIAAGLPDLLLGGGWSTMEAALADTTAVVVQDKDALFAAAEAPAPLVGIFDSSTLPYAYDGYGETIPSLGEMVDFALDRLETAPEGFVLVVEGARIDHASHGNDAARVHPETTAFDEAIGIAMDRVAAWTDSDVSLLVTADHECGGIEVVDGSAAGEQPETSWRWNDHTNADVPLYASGWRAEALDGQRLDNLWVHALLSAAIEDRELVAPSVPLLVDGDTEELGAAVTTQTWESSFGAGLNQLDGLRLLAGEDGLRFGVDGVFESDSNAVVVLIDLDYGAGTGLGADGEDLVDDFGELDPMLSALRITAGIDGLGFDAAVSSMFATEARQGELYEQSGLRAFYPPIGDPADLWWFDATVNFDDGNVARGGAAARDAGPAGGTENGFEALVPWTDLFAAGIPTGGTDIAVLALLVNSSGDWLSNQVLPPLAADVEPADGALEVGAVVVLRLDEAGVSADPGFVVP
jgi:alkaline phosphatase